MRPAFLSLPLVPNFPIRINAVTTAADVVTLDLGGDYVEFSAAQVAAADESDSAATQVAIGAVVDGNPILRLLDHDNDGRLTHRKRQALADCSRCSTAITTGKSRATKCRSRFDSLLRSDRTCTNCLRRLPPPPGAPRLANSAGGSVLVRQHGQERRQRTFTQRILGHDRAIQTA